MSSIVVARSEAKESGDIEMGTGMVETASKANVAVTAIGRFSNWCGRLVSCTKNLYPCYAFLFVPMGLGGYATVKAGLADQLIYVFVAGAGVVVLIGVVEKCCRSSGAINKAADTAKAAAAKTEVDLLLAGKTTEKLGDIVVTIGKCIEQIDSSHKEVIDSLNQTVQGMKTIIATLGTTLGQLSAERTQMKAIADLSLHNKITLNNKLRSLQETVASNNDEEKELLKHETVMEELVHTYGGTKEDIHTNIEAQQILLERLNKQVDRLSQGIEQKSKDMAKLAEADTEKAAEIKALKETLTQTNAILEAMKARLGIS